MCKRKYLLLFLLFIIFIKSNSLCQNNQIDKEIIKLKQKYSIPKLTKNQMYEDFDSLYNIIKNNFTQLKVREIVTGHNILSELLEFKKEIASIDNTEDYILLVNRALNLLQDGHSKISVDVWHYKNSYYKKHTKSFTESDYALTFLYDSIINKNFININCLRYINGRYFFKIPLKVFHSHNDSTEIPQGSELLAINNTNICKYIDKNYFYCTRVLWDFDKKCFYSPNIPYIKKNIFNISFLHNNQKINISNIDNIVFNKKTNNFMYLINSKKVIYFEEDSTLYIFCPAMFTNFIDYFKKEIPKYKNKPIQKIIIDVRGNSGGNDEVWMTMLRLIIAEPFIIDYYLLANNSNNSINILKKENKFNKKNLVKIEFLNNASYLIFANEKKILKPFKNSLFYNKNIYIIQDDGVFSSTQSFISIAAYNNKIINVGMPNNQLGGLGISAPCFKLPNSKIIFTMDILMDATNAKSAFDIYHNKVKLNINPPLNYFIFRINNREIIKTQEYLYTQDTIFKTILKMK